MLCPPQFNNFLSFDMSMVPVAKFEVELGNEMIANDV